MRIGICINMEIGIGINLEKNNHMIHTYISNQGSCIHENQEFMSFLVGN